MFPLALLLIYVIGLIKNHRTIIREPHWHSCVMFFVATSLLFTSKYPKFCGHKNSLRKKSSWIWLEFCFSWSKTVFHIHRYIHNISSILYLSFTMPWIFNSVETWIGALVTNILFYHNVKVSKSQKQFFWNSIAQKVPEISF